MLRKENILVLADEGHPRHDELMGLVALALGTLRRVHGVLERQGRHAKSRADRPQQRLVADAPDVEPQHGPRRRVRWNLIHATELALVERIR